MTLTALLVWVLRLFGALYLVGGLIMARQMWFWARITPTMDKFIRTADAFNAEFGEGQSTPPERKLDEDHGRPWWLFAGGLLTTAAGAAMLLAHASAPIFLALIIVHQLLYFVRQRRRELAASNADSADEARPNRATINGFFAALLMAVLSAWLGYEGALWWTL